MKKKIKFFLYTFIVLGFVFIYAGCKKDETKIDPVIIWENPADIIFGTLLSSIQLNATTDVPGIFVYTPASGTQLNVGANQSLKVNFTPIDAVTYDTISKTVIINVIAKIDPVITWDNPDDIILGTLLSSKQLNATADIPGIFVYTPASGTLLNVGASQSLKVDFTPTDANTHNAGSKTASINVIALTTVTDIEGNIYKTRKIGTQEWMAENLKTTRYNDSTAILNVTENINWFNLETAAYCNYDNLESNAVTFGRLYNWHAVGTGKIAPAGWHVPTEEDWTKLENYVAANPGTSGSVAKALASSSMWESSNTEKTIGYDLNKNNSTGFNALPGGFRYYPGTFSNIVRAGFWWSSNKESTDYASGRTLGFSSSNLSGFDYPKGFGFSVRCVKD